MAEFTGERLIPGQVDVDLLNEHVARYTFAARLARGRRVLDAGCGAGYGAAELASMAESVVGIDRAPEAVEFARANYQASNLAFAQGSCNALPYRDSSFELVVAFEVIEHLEDWRGFLEEAKRVLRPCGQLIVSTPNKLYYTESRGPHGANPFHVHEFTFDEFRAELKSVFPHVTLFLENHVEGVTFQPHETGHTVEARVDAGEPAPDESHFFVAVCAHRPQLGNPTFVYIPRAANVLRERERHIALLENEVADKSAWLEEALAEHESLMRQFAEQTVALERSNQWSEALNREVGERRARIVELQEEMRVEQAKAVQMAEGYKAAVAALEREVEEKAQWATQVESDLTAEIRKQSETFQEAYNRQTAELDKQTGALGKAVDILHQTERELEERTAWANRLQAEVDGLSDLARALASQLALVRASRWVKLGRRVGLGPALPPA